MGHGQVAEVPMARTIVPNVNRISAALRAAGGVVTYTQHTADAEAVRTWSVFFEHFCGPERRAPFIEAFTPGNAGHALWSELDVAESRFAADAAIDYASGHRMTRSEAGNSP
jgi:ureidoacrylate peracid hydrolase